MSALAVLFPGQGEQVPGMLHDLPPAGADVLATAADVLGADPLALDTPASLAGTGPTQLALLLAAVAWYREAVAAGLRPDYLAGHSIGLWGAAVAADALDLADAVRLVDLRGRAMAAAAPPGSGMLVSLGLPARAVEAEADAVRAAGGAVWASNVNAPTQVAVSGATDALDDVERRLAERGAQRVVRLRVAVPAHSPLMAPAARAVREALADVEVRRPRLPVAGNVTGQTLRTAERLRTELADGIDRPVRWETATAILAERGVGRWVQLPPGRSLSDLARALPGARAWSTAEVGLAETVARASR